MFCLCAFVFCFVFESEDEVRIYENERYAALVSRVAFKSGKFGGFIADTKMILMIEQLKQASSQIRDLAQTQGDAFEVVERKGVLFLVVNKSGKCLLRVIRSHALIEFQYREIYKFEPYIEVAERWLDEFGLRHFFSYPGSESLAQCSEKLALLNNCADKIRKELNSKAFQCRLKNYNRSANKNYKELLSYVDSLFERYSRLLVVRVDLSYLVRYSNLTQQEAGRDRERLFENSRSNKLFANMVGYIWKLEHGTEKGFHFHVMFFFDGSKVREDGTMAKLIGQYWIDVVTKGRGMYFNCNASKDRYIDCGVGMIDCREAVLHKGIRKAVIYLTKTDLYMKLQSTGRGMGKGNKPKCKDVRGRPRAEISSRV